MISNELKDIIDKLKEQGKMRFVESVTEAQIFEFEKLIRKKMCKN